MKVSHSSRENKNPWKTTGSKEVYTNNWIKVTEHQVISPGNKNGIYGVVSFKNYAIGIIPIDENFNTWLVGQYRYPLEEYSWEIPMGGGPRDEEIMSSAKRELLEETGITANSWEQILKIHTSNSVTDETGFIFVARDLSFQKAQPEHTERLEIKKLPLDEAIEMVHRGQITDSLSIAGLLKVAHLFK